MSQISPNDLGVIQVPTRSPSDIRTPKADDFELDKRISVDVDYRINSGFKKLKFEFTGNRLLNINGEFVSAIAKNPILVNTNIEIPALADTQSVVDREDQIYFINFVAEIGSEVDSSLNVQIQYRRLDESGQPTEDILTTPPKENTRRYRYYWGFVHSTINVTPETFWSALEKGEYTTTIEQNGALVNQLIEYDDTIYRFLPVTTLGDSGFTLSNGVRIYVKDPNLVNDVNYKLINGKFELIEICRIVRKQNVIQQGYNHGSESPLTVDYNLKKRHIETNLDLNTQSYQRMIEIMGGHPGINGVYQRTVKNLVAGQISGASHPGEIAASPNGSVALANDQRSNFSNQRIIQTFSAQKVTAQNAGDGFSLLTATLNTNAPVGSIFSDANADHKIYDNNGLEQSAFGQFIKQIGSGLSWRGGANSTIGLGDTAYFCPGVRYSGGSGFTEPFVAIEKAWRNEVALNEANVRSGLNDLAAYESPANNEDFILIYGVERGAIHRIYRRITVTTDSDGIARIPDSEHGIFAFINGITGRIDLPVVTGLSASTEYDALIHYIPKSSGDTWQLQFKYLPYQGVGGANLELLDGGKIVSDPLFFVHTLGGGCSCYRGEGSFQYTRISSHLPAVVNGVKDYDLDNPIHELGQDYQGPITFKQMNLIPGKELVLPKNGMILNYVVKSSLGHPKSLNVALQHQGKSLGFKSPQFANSEYIYQYVLGFMIEKNGIKKLLIATHNNLGNLDIVLDSDKLTAIDLFDI